MDEFDCLGLKRGTAERDPVDDAGDLIPLRGAEIRGGVQPRVDRRRNVARDKGDRAAEPRPVGTVEPCGGDEGPNRASIPSRQVG